MVSARRSRRLAAALAGAAVLLAVGGPAQAARPVSVSASVDGRALAGSSRAHPVALKDEAALVTVRVANRGSTEAVVRSVRLQGRVIGLTLFSYEARVELRVAPGSTEELSYAIELVDLGRQGVGLIPARVQLLDEKRRELAAQSFTSDVKGSLLSVYGLFGMAVAGITAALLAGAFARLATRRLPANRARRGLRFATAGIGVGMTLTFSLSAFRLLLPAPGLWLALIGVCGAGMFAFGYLTPGPDDEDLVDGPPANGDGRTLLASRSA